ncbi:MAG: YwmB family TATA-box binding protein [Dehalobacterium sp.]|jgi:hypothetical protein
MKIKQKKYFVILIGMIAFGYSINYYYFSTKPTANITYASMESSLEQLNATFAEAKLQGWGKVQDAFSTPEELASYGAKIQEIMGLMDPITTEDASGDSFRSFKLKGKIAKNYEAEVVFQSLTDTKNLEETYLIISMVDRRGTGFLDEMHEKINRSFQLFDQKPKINQLLISYYPGQLSPQVYHNKINEIFSTLGGSINGEAQEDNYLSKTGYVPNLGESLQVIDQDVNLQVAMFYDEWADRTYLYLGSPLIYADY